MPVGMPLLYLRFRRTNLKSHLRMNMSFQASNHLAFDLLYAALGLPYLTLAYLTLTSHITLPNLPLPCLALPNQTLPYLSTLLHLIGTYTTLPHLTLAYLSSPNLTSHFSSLPCLNFTLRPHACLYTYYFWVQLPNYYVDHRVLYIHTQKLLMM